jgi:quercetin dioxygenase-like cupin family protein
MPGYVRIHTDEEGETHFSEVPIELKATDYAPPAPPLEVSAAHEATRFVFVGGPPGWVGDWPPSPIRQFVFILAGAFTLTVSQGDTRTFSVGDVVLLEDTTGKGHHTAVTSAEPALAAMCHLD